ncbi:MAG: glycine cleavage system protein GcvH [Chloroflexota bacterium]|nr:glycine cleavage system protein GcvH [Chloroflexota bacterium]
MSDHPSDLKYTTEHEWVRAELDGTVTIGITFFAQDQLGDVVYLVLPDVGETIEKGSKMGEVESVKSISDLFVPVSGVVLEINKDAIDHPERINDDPHGAGWMVKVKLSNDVELEQLLSSDDYDKTIAS